MVQVQSRVFCGELYFSFAFIVANIIDTLITSISTRKMDMHIKCCVGLKQIL